MMTSWPGWPTARASAWLPCVEPATENRHQSAPHSAAARPSASASRRVGVLDRVQPAVQRRVAGDDRADQVLALLVAGHAHREQFARLGLRGEAQPGGQQRRVVGQPRGSRGSTAACGPRVPFGPCASSATWLLPRWLAVPTPCAPPGTRSACGRSASCESGVADVAGVLCEPEVAVMGLVCLAPRSPGHPQGLRTRARLTRVAYRKRRGCCYHVAPTTWLLLRRRSARVAGRRLARTRSEASPTALRCSSSVTRPPSTRLNPVLAPRHPARAGLRLSGLPPGLSHSASGSPSSPHPPRDGAATRMSNDVNGPFTLLLRRDRPFHVAGTGVAGPSEGGRQAGVVCCQRVCRAARDSGVSSPCTRSRARPPSGNTSRRTRLTGLGAVDQELVPGVGLDPGPGQELVPVLRARRRPGG